MRVWRRKVLGASCAEHSIAAGIGRQISLQAAAVKTGLPETGSVRGFVMETKEINTTAWEAFCRKLQEIRPRTVLTIERVARDGHHIGVVNNLELREARLDRNDGCNDIINFTMAEDNGEIIE